MAQKRRILVTQHRVKRNCVFEVNKVIFLFFNMNAITCNPMQAGNAMCDKFAKRWHKMKIIGETGKNDTWGKMKQRDFSNDDAIYDVSYSNWMCILKSAIL